MNVTIKQKTAANAYIEKLILSSDPLSPLWNRENFIFRKQPKWNYIDSIIVRALLMLYEHSGDGRLLEYALRFTDAYVAEDGSIPTFRPDDRNIDNFCGGRNLIKLWRYTDKQKYLSAAEKLFHELICCQPRTASGNFWHKAIYPEQVWLDGAYMALPFLTDYAALTGDRAVLSDVESQLDNIRIKMRDSSSGLYRHGFDESRSIAWADSVTGLSGEFWLRSMGWLAAGLSDICESSGGMFGDMLSDLLNSLKKCLTPEGMLLQLPLRAGLEGNYPETSGTLLFAYAAMKATRLGITNEDIKNAGIRAFGAVSDKYIGFSSEGIPVLKNICLMAGLGGVPFRDGSAAYYLSEPMVENDAKGIAPYLMAYSELIRTEAVS